MSLVTRATSAPRRSSLWSARLIRWMCSIKRVRRSLSACSLRTPSRTTAVRWQTAGDRRRAPTRDQRAPDDEVHRAPRRPIDAAVDRLLDEDRHDHPPTGADRRQQPGERQALPQDRRLLEPTPDRRGRREAPHRLGHRRLVMSACRPVGLERFDQLAVGVDLGHQLVVRAVGGDPAVFDEQHVVGEGDRRRARGDHHHGRVGERRAQVAEHRHLGRRVERRGRVVEQQQASACVPGRGRARPAGVGRPTA